MVAFSAFHRGQIGEDFPWTDLRACEIKGEIVLTGRFGFAHPSATDLRGGFAGEDAVIGLAFGGFSKFFSMRIG